MCKKYWSQIYLAFLREFSIIFYGALFSASNLGERSENRVVESTYLAVPWRDGTSRFSGPFVARRTLGGLALHGGSKNVHHPCTRLNDGEAYKVDASFYVTLDFTFAPETPRAVAIKRRGISRRRQSISQYITLYFNSTL